MSASTFKLRGITWNHTRGYLPLVATAQRFLETHAEIEIRWEKRSLQEFADFPIQKLAETFDLLVIDHPFVGYAAAHGTLLPLDEYLPDSFLSDQAQNSVGKSHASYFYERHQWALAIDAAAPVSSFRRDLLHQAGVSMPRTWQELLELARRGLVAFPGIPVDSLMNFYMLCSSLGEDPFRNEATVVGEEIGGRALEMLRELILLCPPEYFSWNPIAIYEAMSSRDNVAYCPFAYGYSNYSRSGYGRSLLEFGDLVGCENLEHCRSTLGGTGLAVSARSEHREVAVEYSQFVAGQQCQATLYFASGGQPGHRQAWSDEEVNRASHHYFRNTLPALDRAYLRPRYNGYLHFQDRAGSVVQAYLRQGGDPRQTLRQLNKIYLESREEKFQD